MDGHQVALQHFHANAALHAYKVVIEQSLTKIGMHVYVVRRAGGMRFKVVLVVDMAICVVMIIAIGMRRLLA